MNLKVERRLNMNIAAFGILPVGILLASTPIHKDTHTHTHTHRPEVTTKPATKLSLCFYKSSVTDGQQSLVLFKAGLGKSLETLREI